MAKHTHAHRLLLHAKRSWRCTLPGCNYFVHEGLSFTISGKIIRCFNCNEEFTAGDADLQAARDGDDILVCGECRGSVGKTSSTGMTIDQYIMIKKVINTNGVKTLSELGTDKIRQLQVLGELPSNLAVVPTELMGVIQSIQADEIEVIDE